MPFVAYIAPMVLMKGLCLNDCIHVALFIDKLYGNSEERDWVESEKQIKRQLYQPQCFVFYNFVRTQITVWERQLSIEMMIIGITMA